MRTETAPPSAPYDRRQWAAIDALGRYVDRRLGQLGVRMTMGGEPTFVSKSGGDLPEWRVEALGAMKRKVAESLMPRLAKRFPAGGVAMDGIGKWCHGENAPRWAMAYVWRRDGVPLWRRRDMLADGGQTGSTDPTAAAAFVVTLTETLGLDHRRLIPVSTGEGWVLPLLRIANGRSGRWASCRWDLEGRQLVPIPGDAPLGLRLPLDGIRWAPEVQRPPEQGEDATKVTARLQAPAANTIRVALCAELRDGRLHLFLPPVAAARSFLALIEAIEATAAQHRTPVRIEGYLPPPAPLLSCCQAVPDPGVLEVNLPPLSNWRDLSSAFSGVYQEARHCDLRPWKEHLDGRSVESGGGCHITIGGAECRESPFLRRPDLLTSFITYWQHHPGLSYAFTGLFAGPCSQTPRVDETRPDALYELEIALRQLDTPEEDPLAVDRHLRHLLTDLTGNRHRAEFCIDKLFPEHDLSNRLGLLELRSVAMPPHPEMALTLCLLLRALACRFWSEPYRGPLLRWENELHDRFALPYFIVSDLEAVAADLQHAGYAFRSEWLQPFIDFRFPSYGSVENRRFELELRQALEPWPILGQEMVSGACSRAVDASVERLQVRLRAKGESPLSLLCNGYPVPLVAAGGAGDFIGGVRFTARHQDESLHPSLVPLTHLAFEIYDARGTPLGGYRYQPSRNGSRFENLVTAQEDLRRPPPMRKPPECPLTLDLRRADY